MLLEDAIARFYYRVEGGQADFVCSSSLYDRQVPVDSFWFCCIRIYRRRCMPCGRLRWIFFSAAGAGFVSLLWRIRESFNDISLTCVTG